MTKPAVSWRASRIDESPVLLSGHVSGTPVHASVASHSLTGHFWHQGAVRFELATCSDPARTSGRYHREGALGAWYGSSHERAAWAELFRHFVEDGVSPFEIRRRVGRVRVAGLRVLNVAEPAVQDALGVSTSALTGDDYGACQDLAELAYKARLDGILAPSAALESDFTLAVFANCLRPPMIVAEHSRVQVPPVSLLDVLHSIRPVPHAADVRAFYDELVRRGRSSLRSRSARKRPSSREDGG